MIGEDFPRLRTRTGRRNFSMQANLSPFNDAFQEASNSKTRAGDVDDSNSHHQENTDSNGKKADDLKLTQSIPQRRFGANFVTLSTTLESMGWDAHFENQLQSSLSNSASCTVSNYPDDFKQLEESHIIPARVTEVRSNGIRVIGPGLMSDQILIPPSSERKRNDVVVGDWVLIKSSSSHSSTTDKDHYDDNEPHLQQSWIINRLLKRKSLLQRRAPGPGRKAQLIAANLDTVFLVSSFNQDFNVARLERYVAMALEASVSPVIVLTKRDVYEDDEADEDTISMLDSYVHDAEDIASGIPVVQVDARGEEDTTFKLSKWCQPGQTVAFLGSSGVGKSTLVNSLCGTCVASTGEIHQDSGQGRHTTTRRQLFFLPNGCAVIDTPGLRELQLLNVSHGLAEVFSDLAELSAQCRFNDCQHDGEPGCAVEDAMVRGVMDGDRVARWQKLVAEDKINSKTMVESKARALQKDMRQKQAKKKLKNRTNE